MRTPDGRLMAMLDYTGGTITNAGSRYYLLDDIKTVEVKRACFRAALFRVGPSL